MSTAVNLIKFVWTYWKLNLAGAMEFRTSFFMMAGMMFVNDFVWIFFWGVFFNRFKTVNGWELSDVVLMWAVSAGGFGLMAVLFGNCNRIANMIATGQLDLYLAQPKPVLLHLLVSRMSVTAIGDLSFSVVVYALFGDRSAAGIAKFVLGLFIAACLFLFANIVFQSLAFYIGNAEGLSMQLYNGMIALTTYPTDIFRGLARLVLFTVIPAGFISYMPIALFRQIDVVFLLQALGAAFGAAALAVLFFYRGLRRYSSGNMLTMRQ